MSDASKPPQDPTVQQERLASGDTLRGDETPGDGRRRDMKAWLLTGSLLAALGAGTMYVGQSARMAESRSRIAKLRTGVERLGDLQRRVDIFAGLDPELRLRIDIVEKLKVGDADLAQAVAETLASLGSLPLDVERLVARGDVIELTVRPATRAGALRDPTALDRALRAAGLEPTRAPLPSPDGVLSFVVRRRPAGVRR